MYSSSARRFALPQKIILWSLRLKKSYFLIPRSVDTSITSLFFFVIRAHWRRHARFLWKKKAKWRCQGVKTKATSNTAKRKTKENKSSQYIYVTQLHPFLFVCSHTKSTYRFSFFLFFLGHVQIARHFSFWICVVFHSSIHFFCISHYFPFFLRGVVHKNQFTHAIHFVFLTFSLTFFFSLLLYRCTTY